MKMHQLPVNNLIVYYHVDDEERAVTVTVQLSRQLQRHILL